MTVTYIGDGIYVGLDGDTKPTNVPTNTLFFETDTGEISKYNGSSYDLIVGRTKTETLLNKTVDRLTNTIKNVGNFLFTVFTDSGTTYCVNNRTGAVVESDSDPTVVIQYAIDNANGESILARAGTYLLSQGLDCVDEHFRIFGEGCLLSGNAGVTGDTIFKADFTGAGPLFDCRNTDYARQQFSNLVIDCDETVDFGILADDVRERYPWLQNVAVVNAVDTGIKATTIVYTTCYNVVIANCAGKGLWIYTASSSNSNTFYMFGGRITSNGINIQIDRSTDIGFYNIAIESGVTNNVKTTAVTAKQIRFDNCSFEWHPVTGTNISCDDSGSNIVYHNCRFDSNNTTYYPITVRAAARQVIFQNCMFQANNGSTTAVITIESGAQDVMFIGCQDDPNTPLSAVTFTDAGTRTTRIANSPIFGDTYIPQKTFIRRTSGSSDFEDILEIGVTDQTGDYLRFQNGTSTNAVFSPFMLASTGSGGNGTSSHLAMHWRAMIKPALDSGSTPVIRFEGRQNDGTTVDTRPILGIANVSTDEYLFYPTQLDLTTNALVNAAINLTNNTVTDSSRATGDIIKDNGTKYVRFARGTAHQVLKTNSGATDLEWGSVDDSVLSSNVILTTNTKTLTNKTINLADNTVTDTSQAAGDLAKNNGTKFVRFARGTANQFLKTNSGATDLEYATLDVTLDTNALTTSNTKTVTNKTIDADSNTISNIDNNEIKAAAGIVTTKLADSTNFVLTNRTNTFGAFDQIFPTSRLLIGDSDASHNYIIAGSNLAANRTVTLPLLSGNDTVAMEAHTATLTNKTINTTDNTVTATSQATGDILKNNGTKFVRLARGTSLQVLRTNSGATDLEWASLDSERTGKALATGNGSTTAFNIAHGLGATPSYAFVDCSSHAIARTWTVDGTNITVTFSTAPPSGGSNNVIIYWRVIA